MPSTGPYLALAIGICLVVGGLIFAAIVVGWTGQRKAKQEGRVCPICELWDAPVEILLHRIFEHWAPEHERE